jgi:hypothetical protein
MSDEGDVVEKLTSHILRESLDEAAGDHDHTTDGDRNFAAEVVG